MPDQTPTTEKVNLTLHYNYDSDPKLWDKGRYDVSKGAYGRQCIRCQELEGLSACANCGYGTFEVGRSGDAIGIFCEQCGKGFTRWTCRNCNADNPITASFVTSGGGCFIATAAFGDYDAPEVVFFRRLRDRVLSRTSIGRATIEMYYLVSPPLASIIATSSVMKRVSRRVLRVVMSLLN